MASAPPKPGEPMGPGGSLACKDCDQSFPSQGMLDAHQDEVHPVICPTCDDKAVVNSIGCDSCDSWYHLLCVGLTPESVPNGDWYCPTCIERKSRPASGGKAKPPTAPPKKVSKEPAVAKKVPVVVLKSVSKPTNGVGVATVKPLPKSTLASKPPAVSTVPPRDPGTEPRRLTKKSEFTHPTAVRNVKEAKRNMKALQTGSYQCKICPGERGGPFPCMKASDDHFEEFHWTTRIEFLDLKCDPAINIPCYMKCNDEVTECVAHYHCPGCDVVNVSPETHVQHAVAQHEYSLVYAENLEQLQSAALSIVKHKHVGRKPGVGLRQPSTVRATTQQVYDDPLNIPDHTIGGSSLTDEQIADLIEGDENGRFHCKLCPPSSTLSSQTAAEHHLMNLHMSSHLVIAGRWVCLPCFQDCGPPLHYHCPLCAMTSMNMDVLLDHTRKHNEYKLAMGELRRKAARLMDGKNGASAKPSTSGVKKPTKGKKSVNAKKPAAPATVPAPVAEEPAVAEVVPAESGPSRPWPSKPGTYAGLMVRYNGDKTGVIVDNAPEQDSQQVEEFFDRILKPMSDGRIRCTLCPLPEDPAAVCLQPHDTLEEAKEHFLKCHYRFRVTILNFGSCLRCLRSCDKTVPDATGHYHCPYCKQKFPAQHPFIRHSLTHVGEQEKKRGNPPPARLSLKWAVPPMDAKPRPPATKKPLVANGPKAGPSGASAGPSGTSAGPSGASAGPSGASAAPQQAGPSKPGTQATGAVKRPASSIPVKADGVHKAPQATKPGTSGSMAPPPAPKPSAPTGASTAKKDAPAGLKVAPVVKQEPALAPKKQQQATQPGPSEPSVQPVVSKRGRISKPKTMSDSIITRPFKRTLSGTRVPRAVAPEPTNSSAPTGANTQAAHRTPSIVRMKALPARAKELILSGRASPVHKSWFLGDTISGTALDRALGRSNRMYYCCICRTTRYKVRLDASNHFRQVHIAEAVYVLNKWTVVPCLFECDDTECKPHFHCPQCELVSMSKVDFLEHVKSHEVRQPERKIPKPAQLIQKLQPAQKPPPTQQPQPAKKELKPRAHVSTASILKHRDAPGPGFDLQANDVALFDDEMGFRCKLCSWSSSVGDETLEQHLVKHLSLGFMMETSVSLPCYRQCSPGMALCMLHYHCKYCNYLVISAKNVDKQDKVVAFECLLAHCEEVHPEKGKPKSLTTLVHCKFFNDLRGKTPVGNDLGPLIKEELKRLPLFDATKPRATARGEVCLMRSKSDVKPRDFHAFINIKLDMVEASNKREIDTYILGALGGFYANFSSCFLCPPGTVLDENFVEHMVKEHVGEIIVVRGPARDIIVDDWKDEYTQYRPKWLCMRCDCRGSSVLPRPHFICPVCECIIFDKEEFVAHVPVHRGATAELGVEESEAFGLNGNDLVRRSYFADGFRVRDLSPDRFPVKVASGFKLISPLAFRKIEEDLVSLAVLPAGTSLTCQDSGCGAINGAIHYHCSLCGSGEVYSNLSKLTKHAFDCAGSPSTGLRSNAVALLDYQGSRVMCKLCKASDGMAWMSGDENEARAHVSKFHLKEGVLHQEHVYPLCRLDCLLVYGKLVNHYHCYGCSLVFITGHELRDHLVCCPGAAKLAVNSHQRANAESESLEPPEKRRKMDLGLLNGIVSDSEAEDDIIGAVSTESMEILEVGAEETVCMESAPVAEEEVITELDLSNSSSYGAEETIDGNADVSIEEADDGFEIPDTSLPRAMGSAEPAEVSVESVVDVSVDATDVSVDAPEDFPTETQAMEEVIDASVLEEPMDTDDGLPDGDDTTMVDMVEHVEEQPMVETEECEGGEAMDEFEKDEIMETKDDKSDQMATFPAVIDEQAMESPEEQKDEEIVPSETAEVEIVAVDVSAADEEISVVQESVEQSEPTVVAPDGLESKVSAGTKVVEIFETPALEAEAKKAIEYLPEDVVPAIVEEQCEAEEGTGDQKQVENGVVVEEKEDVVEGPEDEEVVEEDKTVVEEVDSDAEEASANSSPDKPSIFDLDDDLEEPKPEQIEGVPAEIHPKSLESGLVGDFATPSPLGAAGNEAAETLISLGRKRDVPETPQQARHGGGGPGGAGVNGEETNSDVFFTPGSVRKVPTAEFVTARPTFADEVADDLAELAPARLVFDSADAPQEGA